MKKKMVKPQYCATKDWKGFPADRCFLAETGFKTNAASLKLFNPAL